MSEEPDYKEQYEQLKKRLEFEQSARAREREITGNRNAYNRRVEVIKAMDTLVGNINHEDYIEDWLMNGVPDDGDETDIEAIACDWDLYQNACKSFLRIMRCSKNLYHYFPFVHYGAKDGYGDEVTPDNTDKMYGTDIYFDPLNKGE